MKSDKLINFSELLSRAWKFVWKYKFLWLLGLLAGGNAGVSGNNFTYLFDSNSNNNDLQSLFSGHSLANSFPSTGSVLGVSDTAFSAGAILLVVLLVIILVVVMIYLNVTARGAIISAINKADENKNITLKESWSFGHKYFWRIFGFSVLYSILIIIPMLFLATPVAIMVAVRWYIPAIIVGFLFALIFIIYAVYLAISIEYGERILVLDNRGVWESVKLGVQFFNKNWKNVLLVYLVLIAVMLAAGTVLAIGILIVGVSAGAIIYGVYSLNSIAAIIVGIPVALVMLVLLLTVSGLIASYRSSILTLAYKEILKLN